jgi:hypothetical protein
MLALEFAASEWRITPYSRLRLAYPALAETFIAGGRIDFAVRFCWLLDLLKPRAITGGANNFGQTLTWLFHNDQSLEQNTNLNSFVGT